MIGVYAPNGHLAKFWHKIFTILKGLNGEHVLLIGEFNVVMNPCMDRSKWTGMSGMPHIFGTMLQLLKLYDVWILKHKELRDYTFFQLAMVHILEERLFFKLGIFMVRFQM